MAEASPAVGSGFVPEAASRPDAAPAEPARTSATTTTRPTSRSTTRPRQRTQDTWRDRMLGEVFFFLLGLGVWLSNAIFTVLGVTAPVGLNLLTGLLGFVFHLLLSRAELYLWHRWRDPWYLLLLIGCVLIDAGTTLVGLLPIAAKWFPVLVGATPQNVLDWGQILAALVWLRPGRSAGVMDDNAGSFVLRFAMNEPRLSDMSEAEFEALIEGHIERIATSDYELPADLFVGLLLERTAARAKRHSAGSETDTAGYPPGTGTTPGDAPGGHHDDTDH